MPCPHGSPAYQPPFETDLYRKVYAVCGHPGHEAAARYLDNRFGRMFRDLPPHPGPVDALEQLGATDGPMNEGTADAPAGDSAMPAGFTFFGQFIDHDITFDPVSRLGMKSEPAAFLNFRTPRLDLDSVYGAGPVASPYLYVSPDAGTTGLLLLGPGGADLPRVRNRADPNERGTAVIGDPRNDENLIVSALHLAVLRFHNRIHEAVGGFETAREVVLYHYHRAIVEDFLFRIIGRDLTKAIVEHGPCYYRPDADAVFMPVEFAVAAYRYGHSQVRDRYDLNANDRNVPLFDFGGFGPSAKPVDLRFMFELDPKVPPNLARKIDTKLPQSVMRLPPRVAGDTPSLAARNLVRGWSFDLPSGQAVARRLAVEERRRDDNVKDLHMVETPLWYYVLQEAKELHDGEQLGPVGGRIVGEVLIGLMMASKSPYLRERWGEYEPPFRVPQRHRRFKVADLIRFATEPGTQPAAAEQVRATASA